jgi:hypothetical protein
MMVKMMTIIKMIMIVMLMMRSRIMEMVTVVMMKIVVNSDNALGLLFRHATVFVST